MKQVIAIKFKDERRWSQAELTYGIAVDLLSDPIGPYSKMMYLEDGRCFIVKLTDEDEVTCASKTSETSDSGS